MGIPYSGSDPLTLAVSLDKPLTKQIVQMAGVDTPRSAVVRSTEELPALRSAGLRFPLVVKPAAEGSSKGIRATSKAVTWDELDLAATAVLESYRQPALVEEFIAGTEITVGLVGNRPPQVVGVMEVVPQTGANPDFMYTLEVKREWERLVSYRCPPHLPEEAIRAVEHAAITAFEAIQCRDVARVDFRVDAHGHPHFLEINPLPGLGDYSDLVLMAEIVGMGYSKLVEHIMSAALRRHGLVR